MICSYCKVEFEPPNRRIHYCSEDCRDKGTRERTTHGMRRWRMQRTDPQREREREYERAYKQRPGVRERQNALKLKRYHERRAQGDVFNTFVKTEQYHAMVERQGGLCAACRQPETALNRYGTAVRALSVDHDHVTGRVRDLLCNRCNTALGLLNEDPERMRRLAAYIDRHKFAERSVVLADYIQEAFGPK